ncbi:MAG: 4Fe-4S dicluster domain-containing protein [Coriobacteriaceae bacterium]|nr:4Fe-4S dicluster domain-containing protein [Coriobacteriaceae bacterium]
MAQLGFYFDMTSCIGCKTCQIACRDRNNLYGLGEIFRRVETYEEGKYPAIRYFSTSDSCNHCERPACMAVCPVKAISKVPDSGEVIIDPEMCIGCKSCVSECPYGEPVFIESEGVVRKCDSCLPLRDKGELPTCVAACPMRALDFGPLDELEKRYGSGLVSSVKVLPSPDTTGPSLRILARDVALA